jgi:hypothetical protein
MMQITINVPDNVPTHIVQQYVSSMETQMLFISECARGALRKKIKASKINTEFNAVRLKTKNYRFDREEANER